MSARRTLALACLTLAACANRCSEASAFDATFAAVLEDRDDAGAKLVVPQQNVSMRVNAGDRAEISFETWTHSTCTLGAKRDASGLLTADGSACTVTPLPPNPAAVLLDASAAKTAEAPVTITLRGGRLTPAMLDLDLEVQSGDVTQRVHAHGTR